MGEGVAGVWEGEDEVFLGVVGDFEGGCFGGFGDGGGGEGAVHFQVNATGEEAAGGGGFGGVFRIKDEVGGSGLSEG